MVEVHVRYVRSLEQEGTINRELECLPTDEGFDKREAAGAGLTPPEFATLLSHTKIALAQELLASDLPEDPYLSSELERYFPTRLREEFGGAAPAPPAAAGDHRVAGRQRPRQPCRDDVRLPAQRRDRGRRRRHRARVRRRSRGVRGCAASGGEIEALDGRVPAETQIAMLLKARILLERATRWLLRNRRRPIDIAATVARYAPGAAALAEALPGLLGASELEAALREGCGARRRRRPARARAARRAPGGARADVRAGRDRGLGRARRRVGGEVYFTLGARLELHWLRDRILDLPRETRWEAMARAALRDDVYSEQAGLTAEVLRSGPGVERWLADNANAVERSLPVLADIRTGGTLDLARLSVAVREMRNLIHSSGGSAASGATRAKP